MVPVTHCGGYHAHQFLLAQGPLELFPFQLGLLDELSFALRLTPGFLLPRGLPPKQRLAPSNRARSDNRDIPERRALDTLHGLSASVSDQNAGP